MGLRSGNRTADGPESDFDSMLDRADPPLALGESSNRTKKPPAKPMAGPRIHTSSFWPLMRLDTPNATRIPSPKPMSGPDQRGYSLGMTHRIPSFIAASGSIFLIATPTAWRNDASSSSR